MYADALMMMIMLMIIMTMMMKMMTINGADHPQLPFSDLWWWGLDNQIMIEACWVEKKLIDTYGGRNRYKTELDNLFARTLSSDPIPRKVNQRSRF